MILQEYRTTSPLRSCNLIAKVTKVDMSTQTKSRCSLSLSLQSHTFRPLVSRNLIPSSSFIPHNIPHLLLLILLERIHILKKTRLIMPLISRHIHILHPKLNRIPSTPLQIIHDTPR
jgi:hypothetical protein